MEISSLPIEAAIGVLEGSDTLHPDARIESHLRAVREILGGDLSWLEQTLEETAGRGPSPGADAARHLISRGGKRVRPIALLLSAACFGPVPRAARELAVVAELVHSATLLHDDVIDEGGERRGAPAARLTWGNGVSVLGGDLLLVHALARAFEHAPEVLPDLVATLRRLVEGEIVQLRGRTRLDPSKDTYERILRDKTASLFGWATRSGGCVAGATHDEQDRLTSFGEELGMAFQLVDDALDYSSELCGKTLHCDLREGKLTLPLVLAVEREPSLLSLISSIRAGDHGPVPEVSRVVVQSGACEETRRRAAAHTAVAVDALRAIRPSPARTLLERVAFELSSRSG